MAKAKIRFLISPTGRPFKLAHNAGEIVELEAGLAQELIDAGMAEDIGGAKIETAEAKGPETAEKAVSKRGRKTKK